ncbi:MAG TPA: FAD-binding oxidoreductase [Caldimonas sp.]|nr:FAD-binding oxidoreductase [Caldimonas sp.]HEX4235998.1 FAD-binding oxidoreductase [Caldimonas sp.]
MGSEPAAAARLPERLPGLEWITEPARVARLSQDFSWFSPVLKRQLADKRAAVAVRPRVEEEVRRVVAACAEERVPITLRGSGTGNYGQSVPLHGGVLLDLSACNAFGWVEGDVGRAQAGIRLADFDRQARPHARELRWLPSTFRSATLGGLFGGGFGGAGSITYGPMAAPGNVLGARVMSVEPEPCIVELRSPEAMLLHHVYGTNGIVLELEVALAPAIAWVECIARFDAFDAALEFASTIASAPGIVKKEVCFLAAQIVRLIPAIAEFARNEGHAVLLLVAPASEAALSELIARFDGALSYRKSAEEVSRSNRTLLEYTWNHTTLHALKVDKGLTYIQSRFDPPRHVEQAKALERLLGGEVLMHLEFLRGLDGAVNASGLQLIRYTSDARLDEIMQIHRDAGIGINNPHVFVVEDGGKQTSLDPGVVAMKQRFDPHGLLNPGKLRSWDRRSPAR